MSYPEDDGVEDRPDDGDSFQEARAASEAFRRALLRALAAIEGPRETLADAAEGEHTAEA